MISNADTLGILGPAIGWFDTQSASLGLSPATLVTTWAIAGLSMFVLATIGTVGGRIGWALFGVLTAGVAFDAFGLPNRWIAAGGVTLLWAALSIPAYRRYRPVRFDLRSGSGRRPGSQDLEVVAAPDPAELLAAVFELTLRRREARRMHHLTTRPATWSVVDGQGHSFRAVTADQSSVTEVVGYASNSEMLHELLSDTTHPTATTRLRFERDELRPSLGDDDTDHRYGAPDLTTTMADFISDSTSHLAELVAHFTEFRREYSPSFPIRFHLDNEATRLNRERPLLSTGELQMRPKASSRVGPAGSRLDVHGWARLHDWLDVRTIVKTQDLRWNKFGDHRPEFVALIADSIRTTEDLPRTIRDRLSDDGHVHVNRYPGPAGPIHEVDGNGLHRSHAFALLDAPTIAAEVYLEPLPLVVDPWTVARHGGEKLTRLWHGLIKRGLLVGEVHPRWSTDTSPVLCPRWVSAPWMLLGADDASAIASAYERTYPGSLTGLGIPRETLDNPDQWARWLS